MIRKLVSKGFLIYYRILCIAKAADDLSKLFPFCNITQHVQHKGVKSFGRIAVFVIIIVELVKCIRSP